MKFNNLGDLLQHIEKDIQKTMTEDVANEARNELVIAIQNVVYNAYTPMYYRRRYDNGGLGSRNYMRMEEAQNGFFMKDFAPLNNGRTDYALDDIVVNGLGYMPFERNFYAEQVKNTEKYKDALKSGLKKRGYTVK